MPLRPFLSISAIVPPEKTRAIDIGEWSIPLTRGKPISLRRGSAFWDHLVINGVDTAIYRMPANYPPPETTGSGHFTCLCGMGTPDLLGSYGNFTVFTSDPARKIGDVAGGKFARLVPSGHRAEGMNGRGNAHQSSSQQLTPPLFRRAF